MPTPFGVLLYARLKEVGISANKFSDLIQSSSGFISNIYCGRRRPPLQRIEYWADLLSLFGKERDIFIETAYLEHCPKLIVDRFNQMRESLQKVN